MLTLIEIIRKATTATEAQRSVLRNAVFQKLLPTYRHLKKQGIVELQRHLPNRNSFLRLHDPSRFSDPLSGKKYSVSLVNALQVPIRGFEVGSLELGISMANIRQQLEALLRQDP